MHAEFVENPMIDVDDFFPLECVECGRTKCTHLGRLNSDDLVKEYCCHHVPDQYRPKDFVMCQGCYHPRRDVWMSRVFTCIFVLFAIPVLFVIYIGEMILPDE